MGVRGEIFSITTFAGDKTYFFNIKENRYKNIYMTIAESVRKANGGFERFQLAVFEEDFAFFSVMLWKAEELIEQNITSWEDKLTAKSGKRFYSFKLEPAIRKWPACLTITEHKNDEDVKNNRVIKLFKDNVTNFSIGFNKCRAYKEGGHANLNKPYNPNKS